MAQAPEPRVQATVKATKTARITLLADKFELQTGYRAKLHKVLITELAKPTRRFDGEKQVWLIDKSELPRVIGLLKQFALDVTVQEQPPGIKSGSVQARIEAQKPPDVEKPSVLYPVTPRESLQGV